MFNDTSGFIKGMIAGLVVGTAVSMMRKPLNHNSRRFMRKNAGKAMRMMGNFVENVTK